MYRSKVLLVDDEPANLIALEAMLAPLGCDLVRASSGSEALRRLLHDDFAVVLLDLQMPIMDGMEVAALIRARNRSQNLPIIFVTASDPSEFPVEQAYAVGAVDYLVKPLNPVILLSKVRFFVELHLKNLQLQEMQQALHAAEMAASANRLQLIVENASDYAFIELDADGVITGWAGGAQRITGWPAAEVLGRDFALLFTADDRAQDVPAHERALALREGRAPDKRWHLRKDGTRFYAEGVTVAVRDQNGATASLAKIFSDATERMVGELEREELFRQAQAANARLESIFHQAPAFLCTLQGPNHVYEMANERYFELIGKGPDILGRPAREVLPEASGQGFIDLLDGVFRTGETFVGNGITLKVRQTDGSEAERILDFVYVALRDADGVVSGVLAHGVDITERKRYETAARVVDERYRKLVESMDEGFCLIDVMFDDAGQARDYRFLEVNPVFSEQTGLGPDTVGKTMLELVPDLNREWIERYGRVATSGQPIRFTEEAVAMGRWFDVYATRLGGPESTTVALLFSDITARRMADEDLRRFAAELSEASRRKSEFLAVLAHELRNPLAPIRTGLEVIQLSTAKPDTVSRVAGMMDRQVNHMVHLIDDLLDVARITSGKVELQRATIRLQDSLASAIDASMPLITSSGHRFEASVPDEPLLLHADPVRISQVVGNLLTNAAKYTPHGGTISLSVARDGAQVVITVADTGVGIPADALPSVFDMFSQVSRNLGRSQGGLGIGLAIVRQLVELHGGQVSVASAGVGQGSTFALSLPLLDEVVPNQDAHDGRSGETPPARRLQVLVADDNADAADLLASLLEHRGHDVVVVNDGNAALATALRLQPQIIFLDIGMPGLTGHEVAREIRKDPAMQQVTLVALTGWGTQEDRSRAHEAGFDHHLTKPAHAAALDRLLRAAAFPA